MIDWSETLSEIVSISAWVIPPANSGSASRIQLPWVKPNVLHSTQTVILWPHSKRQQYGRVTSGVRLHWPPSQVGAPNGTRLAPGKLGAGPQVSLPSGGSPSPTDAWLPQHPHFFTAPHPPMSGGQLDAR